MSQSAIIAFQNEDDTFDIYWSHNGGEQFYLKPYLEDVIDGERERTLPEVDAKLPPGAPDSKQGVAPTLKQSIVPEPEMRDVPRNRVGNQIDYLAYEAFYFVADGRVELYYPMWTYPDVLRALRDMFDLEVYPREDVSTDFDDREPVATFSDSAYSGNVLRDVKNRAFFDAHELGIFQTAAGKVNNASSEEDLERTWLIKNETVKILPKTIRNQFEPYRGNGILINVPWDADSGSPIGLESIIHTAASLRIDVSLALLTDVPEEPDTVTMEQYERGLIQHAYGNFGLMITPQEIQRYSAFVKDISAELAPDTRVVGEEYRVIDTDRTTALFKPTEQYGKIGSPRVSKLSSDDALIVDLDKTPVEFEGVAEHIDNGDIVIADVDDSSVPAKVKSLQLKQKFPLVITEVDSVPKFIQTIYNEEVKPAISGDKLPSVRPVLESEYETISDGKIDIGEYQVTYDPDDQIWDGLEFGEVSEQVYGQFLHTSKQPQEALLCNPTGEPYWFGFLMEMPRTGFARYWRRQLGYEYQEYQQSAYPEDYEPIY